MKGCEVTVWSCPYFKLLPFSWHDLQLSWLASALIKHPAGPWMAKKHQCTTLKAVFLMSTKSWQPYPMIKVMRYGCKWRHHLSPDCPAFMLTLIILYRNNRTMVDHSVHHCGIGWRGNYRHISGKRNEVIVTEQLVGSVMTYPPRIYTQVDEGGSKRFFQNVWTSFLKARLVCGFPGESLYFNRLQDTYVMHADDWHGSRIYALFTSSWLGTFLSLCHQQPNSYVCGTLTQQHRVKPEGSAFFRCFSLLLTKHMLPWCLMTLLLWCRAV